MTYRHLLFDLDRTLWDYDANSYEALTRIFNEFDLQKYYSTPEEFLKIYHAKNDQLWDDYRNGKIKKGELRRKRFAMTLKEKKVVDTVLSSEIGSRYMYLTPRLNNLAPNTIQTLEYLKKRGYSLYILTNGFISTQEKKMKHSNISGYFKRLFSSEELGVNKPRKEIFHWAVSSLHAKKSECLMIGDDFEVDIVGAMNYGIDSVWFNPAKLAAETAPTYTIADLSELESIL